MIKKIILTALIVFNKIYCFDFIEDIDDFIEDGVKLIIMALTILAVICFVKKMLKDENNLIKKYYENAIEIKEYYEKIDKEISNDTKKEENNQNIKKFTNLN